MNKKLKNNSSQIKKLKINKKKYNKKYKSLLKNP